MKTLILGLFVGMILFSSQFVWGKTVNFRFNALPLLIGMFDTTIDVRINNKLTLGPKVVFWNYGVDDLKLSYSGYGIRGNYHFSSVFQDGFYLGPYANVAKATVTEKISGKEYKGEATGTTFGAMFGYHWFWKTFNLNLGAGPTYVSISKIEGKSSDGSEADIELPNTQSTGIGIEFLIGFSF